MSKFAIVNSVTRSFHKAGFQLKKHSPEILVVAGVVGVVASAVMACKATTKVSGVLDKAKEDIEVIHEGAEKGYIVDTKTNTKVDYSVEDSKKDLTITYVQTGLKLVKLYAPSVIFGALSITGILASNHILRKRNVALAAAYTVVDKGFKQYRGRVVERFGEELDKELKYGIKAKEVEEVVQNEDGTETVVKKTINVASQLDLYSDYARFFDDGCAGWDPNTEYSLTFLKHQQNYANDLLKSRGHLFLNEVYDMLGIPRSKAGQVVGWIYDPTDNTRDNYVDFGIYDTWKANSREFVNGHEPVIILDFNVDGDIWHEMQ